MFGIICIILIAKSPPRVDPTVGASPPENTEIEPLFDKPTSKASAQVKHETVRFAAESTTATRDEERGFDGSAGGFTSAAPQAPFTHPPAPFTDATEPKSSYAA